MMSDKQFKEVIIRFEVRVWTDTDDQNIRRAARSMLREIISASHDDMSAFAPIVSPKILEIIKGRKL